MAANLRSSTSSQSTRMPLPSTFPHVAEPDKKLTPRGGTDAAKRDKEARHHAWLVPATEAERWRSAMAGRGLLLLLGIVIFVGHTVAPETVQLDAEGLTLLGILVLVALAPVLKDFKLPGGGGGTFVDGVNDAAAALERSESDRTEEVIDATVVEDLEVADALADVEQLAAAVPQEAVLALRREMSDRLRQVDLALIGGTQPASDYEVVRRLAKGGVIDQELASAAYAVLGATERGAREREVPVAAVRELIAIADRLLRDLASSANPGLQFATHVKNVLKEMAGPDRVIDDPTDAADFRVHNTLIEAKHVRPGVSADVVAARTARRLAARLKGGMRGLVILNDDADLTISDFGEVPVVRLKDLQREQLPLM